MNVRMSLYVVAYAVKAQAVLMLPSLGLAFWDRDFRSAVAFAAAMVLCLLFGVPVSWKRPAGTAFYAKDGFAAVALCWIVISVTGALPYWWSGAIPGFTNCFFESVSGFTTTGSSILSDIEALPRAVLFWRAQTHWIGGMGVLMFILTVMGGTDGHFLHLMRAESPGPEPSKLVPRLKDTAKILYGIYLAMTVAECVALMITGMPWFDSVTNALSTAGTGGFSVRNASVAAYNSPAAEWIITVFMLLFSVNFNVYYFLLMRRWSAALKNTELRVFSGIVMVSAALIAVNLGVAARVPAAEGIRAAAFQTASIISTTGFVTKDFNLWPGFAQLILVLLMLVGACAGSTGGGIKVSRVVIACKSMVRYMRQIAHPKSVLRVKMDGRPMEEHIVSGVSVYLLFYAGIIIISTAVMAAFGYDLGTSHTVTITSLGNVGPGLYRVGPIENYGFFHPFCKWLLSAVMLFGRLEIVPLLVLFSPAAYLRRLRGN